MAAFAPAPKGGHHPAPWRTASGGFAFDVTAELVIPEGAVSSSEGGLDLARVLVFLLRLWVDPAIRFPVVASRSFSALKELPDDEAEIRPVEVEPRAFPLQTAEGESATHESLQWIRDHWRVTNELVSTSKEFALAVDALDRGQFVPNSALALVSLWGALEVLFCPGAGELRFRVSSFLAAFLEGSGEERARRQREIARLYDLRSAAAHGRPRHDPEQLLETFNLLRDALIEIIERGSIPSDEQLRGLLFGVTDE